MILNRDEILGQQSLFIEYKRGCSQEKGGNKEKDFVKQGHQNVLVKLEEER